MANNYLECAGQAARREQGQGIKGVFQAKLGYFRLPDISCFKLDIKAELELMARKWLENSSMLHTTVGFSDVPRPITSSLNRLILNLTSQTWMQIVIMLVIFHLR